MRRLPLLCACLAALAGGAPATAAEVRGHVVGIVADDAPAAQAALQQELGFRASRRYTTALRGFAARLTDEQVARLREDPRVGFVQRDVVVRATGTADQTIAAGETVPAGIRRIGAASVLLAHGPSDTAVAVLDTGADFAGPDLDVVHGTNCVRPGTLAADDNGHGTHVAGVVAARNTGAGVLGVAPGTRVYAVKVLNKGATGRLSQLLCGIDWVTRNADRLGISVANMSITSKGVDDGDCGRTAGDAQHAAICAAAREGVLFVASAGNTGRDYSKLVPAAYDEVLTVTAMTDTDALAGGTGPEACGQADDAYGTYSSFAVSAADAAHTVAAPGTCVVSSAPGGSAATYTGTSQAAPHVAGAVALCLGTAAGPGPCAGRSPAEVLARVRADAAGRAAATGYAGDLLRPVDGRVYGPLVAAQRY